MNTKEVADRVEYVRRHIIEHMDPVVGLVWADVPEHIWPILRDLSVIDRASGWSSPVLDGHPSTLDPIDGPIIVRFCPEVIVASTLELPISPEPGGNRPWMDLPADGIEAIRFLDNYIRFVEHVLDMEVVLWPTVTDPVLRRHAAEEALYTAVPAAMRLLSMIQSAALYAVTG